MRRRYKFRCYIEKKHGKYLSHCIDLYVSSQGFKMLEAINSLKEACDLCFEHAEERGNSMESYKSPFFFRLPYYWSQYKFNIEYTGRAINK